MMRHGFVTRLREQLRTWVSGRCSFGEMRSRYDTSDVLQESMLQICTEIESGTREPNDYSPALLRSIVRGHSVTLRKHHLAQKRAVANQQPVCDDSQSVTDSPLDQAIRSEKVSRLVRALSQFDEEDRNLINYRVIKDLSFPMIANELELPEHTVRRRFNSLIEQLQTELEAE